jgi:hypothetical protein
MSDGADFIRSQDEKIELLRVAFHERSKEFAQAFKAESSTTEQASRLQRMHESGTEYYRCVEAALLDHDGLRGEDFERWLLDRTGSALNVLAGLPKYFAHLRTHRARLGLRDGMFEPSPGVFQNMQSVLAACRSEAATDLKQKFLVAHLPTAGFDTPFMPRPSLAPTRTATPSHPRWWLIPVYVFSILLLLIGLSIASMYVSPWLFIPVVIAVIILITIVGAFQLKNDDKLADKPFVDLMGLALKKKFEFLKGFGGGKR